jgi:uncharacterized membrane protein
MHTARGDFEVGQAITYGWRGLVRNLVPLAGIALVVFAVNLFVSVLDQEVNTTAGRIGTFLLSTIVSLLVGMGWIRVALTVVDGGTPSLNQLFRTDDVIPYAIASFLLGIAVGLGLVLFIVPGIYLLARYGFTTYAIVDEGLGIGAAFQRSSDITEGHRGKLVLFGLALVGLNLLGLLAFIVGVILTSGVTILAVAFVYRRISGAPVADLDGPRQP